MNFLVEREGEAVRTCVPPLRAAKVSTVGESEEKGSAAEGLTFPRGLMYLEPL